MKKRLASAIIAMAAFSAAMAVAPETVILTNGTTYMGHTSVKNLEKEFSTFMVDSAIVVVDGVNIDCYGNEKTVENLNPRWKAWLAAHPQYVKKQSDGSGTVMMYRLDVKGKDINDVIVLERGDKYVKYLDMAQYTVSIPDADVVSYNYAPRGELDLSGMIDEVYTDKGVMYTGQIVMESPNGVGILTSDNIVEIVPWDKLRRTRKRPLNPKQTFDEQVEYYDNIQTEDRSFRGITTEINYKPGDKEKPYYVVREAEGVNENKVFFDNAKEIRLVKNNGYKPLTDIVLADGQAAINREIAPLSLTEEVSGTIFVDIESMKINLEQSTPKNITAEFLMENPKAQQLKLVKIRKYQDKKGESYGFTFEDMVKNAVLPKSVDTSVKGISRIEYVITTGAGIYGIYDPLTNKIILFKVGGQEAVG